MLFNTVEFFLFFIVVYFLYRSVPWRWQNRLLLVASYVFYGFWDWRFLSLILISTIVDYVCGLGIERSQGDGKRRLYLIVSVFCNLSILGFFKYFNFFVDSLVGLLGWVGFSVHPVTLHIILPLGISFYTFQTMSYTIDIYYRRITPTRCLSDFALFVAFFPQLVAGPIEKAHNLLPQIQSPRRIYGDDVTAGTFLIGWGLFQKVFIADNLAHIVDPVFAGDGPVNGACVLIAVYAFAFQILCDFDGYSNIARGVARLMGFHITVNFRTPYFATDPRDFWRRWHISLSTWLRDYLYIPLGGSRKGTAATYRNLFVTMLLGGLWHGANWTFVCWGVYHGVILMMHRFVQSFHHERKNAGEQRRQILITVIKIGFMFHAVCFGWLVFRSQSIAQVFDMARAMLFNFHMTRDIVSPAVMVLFLTGILLVVHLCQYIRKDVMIVLKWPVPVRAFLYVLCIYLTIIFGETGGHEFIYFTF